MKTLLLSLLLLLPLTSPLLASNSCGNLFAVAISKPVYQKYDPNKIDEQIDLLLRKGELAKIRNANPQKTNLPYFEDFVLDALDKLIKIKMERNDPVTTRLVDEIGVEVFKRIAQEELTYDWVIEFSYRAMAIFEKQSLPPSNRNLDRIKNSFPYDIMIPTFADIDFRHYIQTEAHEFTFLGMKEKESFVDGNKKAFTPEQFSNHDFLHYYLTQKNDVVLDPHHNYHKRWLDLHEKIKNKIENLPEDRRRYTEYIYFFILHEEFGLRTKLLQRYLNPKTGSISQFAAQILDFETITNHYNGIAHPGNVEKSEVYKRTTRSHDFVDSFSEKTNPQEILLVGIGDFLKILKEIESE